MKQLLTRQLSTIRLSARATVSQQPSPTPSFISEAGDSTTSVGPSEFEEKVLVTTAGGNSTCGLAGGIVRCPKIYSNGCEALERVSLCAPGCASKEEKGH